VSEDRESLTFATNPSHSALDVRPSVLIVDDNRDFLRLLSLEWREATKWNIRTAQSVAEAATIGSSQTIDFALLDLFLPDGNGIELGTTLLERQSGIHVAIMTGAELSHTDGDECRKLKFDVVNKPFLPQQIIDLARERFKSQARASA
jgi:DNA-binding NtrC family response regulator